MTANNFLYQHWKKQQTVFHQHLAGLQQRLDATAIHDIRVATKKLRSYISFYAFLADDQQHYFGKTEALFDVLGKLRNIEVSLELVSDYKKETGNHLKLFQQFLLQQLKPAKAWSNEAIHLYHKKELAKIALLLKQETSAFTDEQLVQQLQQLINRQSGEIKKILREPHRVRKQLKEIWYWISLLPGEEFREQYKHDELHDILETLGHWQDMGTLFSFCHHFRKDFLPGSFSESDSLKILEDGLLEKKKQLQHKAMNKVKKWISGQPAG